MSDIKVQASTIFKLIDYNKVERNNNVFSLIEYVNEYINKEYDDYDPEINGDYYLDEEIAKEVKVFLINNNYVTDASYNADHAIWDLRLTQQGIKVIKNHAGDLIEFEDNQFLLKREKKKDEDKETKRFWIPIIISIIATILSFISLLKGGENSNKDELRKLEDKNKVLTREVELLNHRLLQIEQKDIVQQNKKADL